MTDVQKNVDEMLTKARMAAAIFTQLNQEETDRIVKAVYEVGFNNRVRLAKMAIDETGMGVLEHKIIKNALATLLIYEDIKNTKTVGVISDDERTGITEIAHPFGPILAIVPMTNPTSTTLFKILISLKSRNPIIISPHRNALNCCAETARLCYEAALAAGAPDDCIQWISESSREQTQALMSHKDMALILATGGSGLVNAAYSSGTPAIGVGAGNVPVYIDGSTDVSFAVEQIILSKTFDNGTICASEQAVVVQEPLLEAVRAEFSRQGGYILSSEEVKKVSDIAFDSERGIMNVSVVGQSVNVIAKLAGIDVPEGTKLLIAPISGVGDDYPLSSEILAPILSLYHVSDFVEAMNLCLDLNYHGGMGHTASIFSNDDEQIRAFGEIMNAGRVVVNMPSSQGAVGGIFNTLNPSFTLGCGTGGKNITTANVSAKDLFNVQRIVRRRMNQKWIGIGIEKILDESSDVKEISSDYHRNY